MAYSRFVSYFPEEGKLLEKQIIGDAVIPNGHYVFDEVYCDLPYCECRRAMIHVKPFGSDAVFAHLEVGWETEDLGHTRGAGPRVELSQTKFKEPQVDEDAPPSRYARAMLAHFMQAFMDRDYAMSLKQHYEMVKEAAVSAEDEYVPEDSFDWRSPMPRSVEKKIGRNEPCPCGSGKKYKKCCGG